MQRGRERKNSLQALQIQLLHPGLPQKEPKSVTTTHAFLQAGMAPGAVRQEPRQGRDQLGWLEQVPFYLENPQSKNFRTCLFRW